MVKLSALYAPEIILARHQRVTYGYCYSFCKPEITYTVLVIMCEPKINLTRRPFQHYFPITSERPRS
jgi:hypothetical protein